MIPSFRGDSETKLTLTEAGLYTDETKDINLADITARSLPWEVSRLFQARATAWLSHVDADLLAGLKKAGFRTWAGPDGAGFYQLAVEKAGGYYFDTGASQMIIRGEIKVRQGEVASFRPGKKVTFQDGSEGEFDEVIFATGYSGYKDTVAHALGEEAASQLRDVYGTDAEGEIRGIARDCGIPHVLFNVGNLASSRSFSKAIVMQILLEREGKLGERYSIAKQAAETVKA